MTETDTENNKNKNKNKKYNFKLVLLGASGVGKTSIIFRYVKNKFGENESSTIGAAFFTHQFNLDIPDSDDPVWIKYEIWDTAGQERYNSLTPMYYRGANAAIIVYDITDKSSYVRAKKWVDTLKQNDPFGKMIIILIGNKVDLEDRRQVTTSEVNKYMKEQIDKSDNTDLDSNNSNPLYTCNMIFMEASAKKSIAIQDIFEKIGRILVENEINRKKNYEYSRDSPKIVITSTKKNVFKCCF